MYTFCIHGRQENWVTPDNGLTHLLKYHLQLETKADVGVGSQKEGIRQSTVYKSKVVMEI